MGSLPDESSDSGEQALGLGSALPAPAKVYPSLAQRVLRARVELQVAAPFFVVFLVGVAAGLPLSLPNGPSLFFVERHYFRPLLVASVVQGLVLWVRSRRTPERGGMAAVGWLAALVAVTILVHFNFKAWMPLVHPRMFDSELLSTDRVFGDLVPAMIAARRYLAEVAMAHTGFNVDPLYHQIFVAMFFAAFCAHAVFDSTLGLRRVVIGACLVLLLGGMLYWVLPAKGPFLYRVVESQSAEKAQLAMGDMFDRLVMLRTIPRGYFAAPLAAMPSLHTAHATLFCIYAWQRVRWLNVLFLPALGWILIEAVATGWHYLLDLVVGAALAWFCVWCVNKLLPEPAPSSASE